MIRHFLMLAAVAVVLVVAGSGSAIAQSTSPTLFGKAPIVMDVYEEYTTHPRGTSETLVRVFDFQYDTMCTFGVAGNASGGGCVSFPEMSPKAQMAFARKCKLHSRKPDECTVP